ncbi:MAG: PP2C family protein-serine/threonine phosphatase, partial [Candidatus Scatosoma sp.]
MLTAKQMQQRLLPAGKQTGGVAYSYMYIPSLEIGGDLPDVYEFGGRVFGVLSDVSGKGISAGMLSAFIRAGFDRHELSVAKAVSALKEQFVQLNQDERSYITVVAVSIDRETRLLHYVLAGHNAPILLRNGRGTGINEIEDPAPPVSNWIENLEYTEKHMSYEAGDLLVLLSDGVTECPNTAGERFGIERVESVLMQSSRAEDFIGKLKNALTVFCGGKFTDDITAVAFDLV